MIRFPDRNIALAMAATSAAALLLAAAIARAVTVEPVAPADPVRVGSQPVPADEPPPVEMKVPSQGRVDAEAMRLAVANDPFQADRSPPAPYRMPSERVEIERPVREEPVPPPPFRLLGTVSMPEENSIALMQVEEATPLIVKVGEAVMGYILQTVDMTGATLTSRSGESLRLAVAPPSPNAPTRASGRNSRGNARGNTRSNTARDAAAAALERLRGSGAPPDVIERVMEQLRGLEERRAVIEIGEPNRVILRGRVGVDTLGMRIPDSPRDR